MEKDKVYPIPNFPKTNDYHQRLEIQSKPCLKKRFFLVDFIFLLYGEDYVRKKDCTYGR
jgi:hypothetical protein